LKLIETELYFYFDTNPDVKFGYVFKEGLAKGESDFFAASKEIVKDKPDYLKHLKNLKWQIFNKALNPVSDIFDWIYTKGVIKNQSPYYLALKDGMEALYTLEGKKTDDFEKIRDRGALTGESKYFWGKKNGKYAIYDVETGEKLTEDFKSSVIAGVIIGRGTYFVGSFGNEIFYIFDLKTGERLTKEFDEHKLIEILKHGDLEKAADEIGK